MASHGILRCKVATLEKESQPITVRKFSNKFDKLMRAASMEMHLQCACNFCAHMSLLVIIKLGKPEIRDLWVEIGI